MMLTCRSSCNFDGRQAAACIGYSSRGRRPDARCRGRLDAAVAATASPDSDVFRGWTPASSALDRRVSSSPKISEGWLFAGATTALHVLTAQDTYGVFRDEYYYLACGRHPAFGYVDHPPLIGWLAWLVNAAGGRSQLALRLLPALVAGAAVYFQGEYARELGGKRFARGLSQIAVAVAPIFLALFGFFSMNAFDVLCWVVASWLLARLLRTRDLRYWLPLGAVVGLGLLNKLSPLFFGAGVAVGLVLTRDWVHLRRRRFWMAVGLATALASPYVLWQVANGWPTLTFIANATRDKNLPLSPLAFASAQALQMNPLVVPLALAGLAWLLGSARAKPFRALGWVFVAVAGLLIFQHAKPYYLAPAYPIVFGAGAVALEQGTARLKWPWVQRATLALVATTGLLLLPFSKPVLPVERFVAYQSAFGLRPAQAERAALGRLPQFFADRLGWKQLAADTASVYRALPPAEQRIACVFGQNYGQAGALEYHRDELGLPAVLSGHNNYYLWGPGACSGQVLLVVGDVRKRLLELFEEVELGSVSHCVDCMPYESERPIWICRKPRRPLSELWPEVEHFL